MLAALIAYDIQPVALWAERKDRRAKLALAERRLSENAAYALNGRDGRTAVRLLFGSNWPLNEPDAREGRLRPGEMRGGLARAV